MESSLVQNIASNLPLVDIVDGNWANLTLSDGPNDNFESIILPRAAMVFAQGLAFRLAPTATASPVVKPLITMPHAGIRASLQRPETQEDWEAKKDTLRRLYLDENLPLKDLMSTMSLKHSFSATERMYKRQFLKWNWRKYNTKGRQQSHINGELVETRYGRPICKRPPRQRVLGLTNQTRNSSQSRQLCSNQNVHQVTGLQTPLLFGNQCYRWTEELYVSLRDLIYGSARQCPVWRECSKFDLLVSHNCNLLSRFELAYKLLKDYDFQQYGAVLRQAFRTVETTIEMESCKIVQLLLLDIPYNLLHNEQNNELQFYLCYVSRMLSAKKPGDPIEAMAKTMHSIFVESPARFSHSLTQLHGMTADYFIDTRGSDDLNSLTARLEVLCINKNDGISAPECQNILRNYSDLQDEAIDLFGKDSQETISIEYHHIHAMRNLRCWNNFENLCQGYISRTQARNEYDWDGWYPKDLYNVASVLRDLSCFYRKTGGTTSYILRSQECIRMLDYINERYEDIWDCGTRATECRMELAQELSKLGRIQEASEVRLDMVRSGYLRKVVENDFKCNTLVT